MRRIDTLAAIVVAGALSGCVMEGGVRGGGDLEQGRALGPKTQIHKELPLGDGSWDTGAICIDGAYHVDVGGGQVWTVDTMDIPDCAWACDECADVGQDAGDFFAAHGDIAELISQIESVVEGGTDNPLGQMLIDILEQMLPWYEEMRQSEGAQIAGGFLGATECGYAAIGAVGSLVNALEDAGTGSGSGFEDTALEAVTEQVCQLLSVLESCDGMVPSLAGITAHPYYQTANFACGVNQQLESWIKCSAAQSSCLSSISNMAPIPQAYDALDCCCDRPDGSTPPFDIAGEHTCQQQGGSIIEGTCGDGLVDVTTHFDPITGDLADAPQWLVDHLQGLPAGEALALRISYACGTYDSRLLPDTAEGDGTGGGVGDTDGATSG